MVRNWKLTPAVVSLSNPWFAAFPSSPYTATQAVVVNKTVLSLRISGIYQLIHQLKKFMSYLFIISAEKVFLMSKPLTFHFCQSVLWNEMWSFAGTVVEILVEKLASWLIIQIVSQMNDFRIIPQFVPPKISRSMHFWQNVGTTIAALPLIWEIF